MGRPKSRVSKVRVVGPLAPSVTEFEDRLRAIGYTALSSVVHLRLLAHLNRWLDARQFGVCELTDEVVEELFAARRASGCTGMLTRRSLTPLLDLLDEQEVLPAARLVSPGSRVEVLLASFHLIATCCKSEGLPRLPHAPMWSGPGASSRHTGLMGNSGS